MPTELIDQGVECIGRDPLAALACFEKAIGIDARCARAWHYRGLALGELDRWAESIESYDTSLMLDSSDIGSWIGKGVGLEKLGCPEDALRCYRSAHEISPDSYAALEGMGSALHTLQRFEEAVACFEKLTTMGRNALARSWAWNYMAASFRRMNRHAEALACCDNAINACPDESSFWVTMGNCLRDLRRFEEAISCHVRALELWPDNWPARLNKALIEEDLGRIDQAIGTYRIILSKGSPLSPADVQRARRRLQKLEERREAERYWIELD